MCPVCGREWVSSTWFDRWSMIDFDGSYDTILLSVPENLGERDTGLLIRALMGMGLPMVASILAWPLMVRASGFAEHGSKSLGSDHVIGDRRSIATRRVAAGLRPAP